MNILFSGEKKWLAQKDFHSRGEEAILLSWRGRESEVRKGKKKGGS